MAEQKSTYIIMGATESDDKEMYFKTSADQVVVEKQDGSKGNLQESLEKLRGLITISGNHLTINMDVLEEI